MDSIEDEANAADGPESTDPTAATPICWMNFRRRGDEFGTLPQSSEQPSPSILAELQIVSLRDSLQDTAAPVKEHAV